MQRHQRLQPQPAQAGARVRARDGWSPARWPGSDTRRQRDHNTDRQRHDVNTWEPSVDSAQKRYVPPRYTCSLPHACHAKLSAATVCAPSVKLSRGSLLPAARLARLLFATTPCAGGATVPGTSVVASAAATIPMICDSTCPHRCHRCYAQPLARTRLSTRPAECPEELHLCDPAPPQRVWVMRQEPYGTKPHITPNVWGSCAMAVVPVATSCGSTPARRLTHPRRTHALLVYLVYFRHTISISQRPGR